LSKLIRVAAARYRDRRPRRSLLGDHASARVGTAITVAATVMIAAATVAFAVVTLY
jgi:hypothetical protein